MIRVRARTMLAALLVTVWTIGLPAQPAEATPVASVSGTVLTVTGDGGFDNVQVLCSAGNVKVNSLDPSTGVASCSTLTEIHIDTKGGFDVVSTSTVIPAQFPALTLIAINSGAEDDSITLGPAGETVNGGPAGELGDRVSETLFASGTTTLTPGSLVSPGQNDTLSSVELFSLTLAPGANTVNTAAWPGPVVVTGNSGADTVTTGGGADSLNGAGGDDVLTAGGGDDQLTGGITGDTLKGGAGTDTVRESGAPVMGGLVAQDASLTAGLNSESLASVEHLAIIEGTGVGQVQNFGAFSGAVDWFGNANPDIVRGSTGSTNFSPGGGNDIVEGISGADHLSLTGVGSTTLTATQAVTALQGTDTISGIDSALIQGSGTTNTLDASAFPGPVSMIGTPGSDTMIGGPAADEFFVEDSDTVQGGASSDRATMFGGPLTVTNGGVTGSLTAAWASIEKVEVETQPGTTIDTTSFSGSTLIFGNDGPDTFLGGPGKDRAFMDLGNDVAMGGGGWDRLNGQGGNDTLNGGTSVDTCKGGPGNDTLKNCERGSA